MTNTAYKTQRRVTPRPPFVPPGWRLVPDKPTEAWIVEMKKRTSYPSTGIAITMMLDTAPKYEDGSHRALDGKE
jgi:hypothetical protein